MTARRRRKDRPDPFDPLDGPISETLDLHGFAASEVRESLPPFLTAARKRNPSGLLHVITGKGRGSSGRPVLRGVVRTLLSSGSVGGIEAWRLDNAGGGYLIRFRR